MELNENYIYIDNNELNTPIFRFTTVERLLPLICKHQNTLSSPRKWSDPFDNIISKIKFNNLKGEPFKHPDRDRVYGQCWTLTEESDAAWRMYVPDGNGVRLKTTIKKLHKSLKQGLIEFFSDESQQGIRTLTPDKIDKLCGIFCFIGQVQYKTEAELSSWFSDPKRGEEFFGMCNYRIYAESLLLKRKAFKPEQEIRLIFFDPLSKSKGMDDFFHYTVEKDFIEQVTFDPRMEEGIYETYSSILKKYDYAGKIDKSTLYQIPNFEYTFKE